MKWFLRMLITLLLLAGWAVLAYLFADYTLGSPKRSQSVEVEIPPDTSLKEIGQILENKKLIRETYFFRLYAVYKNRTNLKAGVYEIEPEDRLSDMLDKFSEGDQGLIKVIIPPGWNARQIADRLEQAGLDGQGFLRALNHKKQKYDFENSIPRDPRRPYRLEGYLYPGTYEFRKETQPEEIVNAMLDQFAKQMDKLQAREKLKSNPLTKGVSLDEWVTVASLVEREGKLPQELPVISGVIYNRLHSKTNNKLMIDASIVFIYSMKGQKITSVTEKMTQIKHPYNTYQITGLPPGPIASPGEATLAAALNPKKHKYEYYVTREDGSGGHYFARTLAEHNRNIARSKKNAAKRE
ncbi:endolytic transglycosylase MltG [Lihuaxuella thermophila]|uniref:Endolytic murein transglycosylase n=1 Tax=Lihuaxuella thermophila TaxID=1173111 RepID=A0A1H8AV81_9BACL|nr:endolytic transglycosylase MltG [Lihuaxuella thermophila]SEM73417.1 UPF0755 protein [Lihuaxuella thermophila]